MMTVTGKASGAVSQREVTATADNRSRPGTTYESLAETEPVKGPGQFITAGNASQLSDGASACVLMEAREAEPRRGHNAWVPFAAPWPWPAAKPGRWYRPGVCRAQLLARHGLTVNVCRPVGTPTGPCLPDSTASSAWKSPTSVSTSFGGAISVGRLWR